MNMAAMAAAAAQKKNQNAETSSEGPMSIAAIAAAAAQKKAQSAEADADSSASPQGGATNLADMAAAAAQKKTVEANAVSLPAVEGRSNNIAALAAASAVRKQTQPNAHNDDSMPASDAELAIKDDPTYTKFFKMLKMGLPMDVVKHAMKRDGMDPSIMDLDHDKSAASQRPPKTDKREDEPPLKEDEKYQKYFKMLKMVSSLFDA